MIEKIITWSIKNRYVVVVLTMLVVGVGWFALQNTPVDAIPDLSENQVIVFTEWMGRSPQLMEDQVEKTDGVALDSKLKDLTTLKSNNLYSFVIERCQMFSSKFSLIGMIVPVSSISSEKFESLQNIFKNNLLTWQSSFSNRSGKLFENVEQRLTIFIGKKNENKIGEYYSAAYKHWYASTREFLFSSLFYIKNVFQKTELSFSKTGSNIEKNIKEKILIKSKYKFTLLSDKNNKMAS